MSQADANALLEEVSAYLKPEDVAQVHAALEFSHAAHAGQTRQSGAPYVTHPIAVARLLTPLHLDVHAIIAALLHDVVEDTPVTIEQIAASFGPTVAELVEGLSKIDKLKFETREDAQAENFRKMLLAMARDVRVILIKLADRLHNMRTLDSVSPQKSVRIARETMDIYAPIAHRLGLNKIYLELQDLSFKYLHPNRYNVLSKALAAARGNRREVVDKIREAIRNRLAARGIKAEVKGREKHLYSIYKKMRTKSLAFAQVLDIYGFRILVDDVDSCYLALGVLHGLYKPFPGKFKDYIAIPKVNGYQSLHTTLFGPYGTPVEVQIRTHEMDRLAESGVAAHWLYKDSDSQLNALQQKTHQWLQSLLSSLAQSNNSAEFLEHLKIDLFPDEVYVFSPKGKIFALPRGATTIDFAYSVHTDIGNRCIAAKVNDELVPLRTELRNGDRVEIITGAQAHPNPAWLGFVVTSKARAEIRHTLRTMHLDESIQLGERLLAQALNAIGINLKEVDEAHWERLFKETGAKSQQEIFADIGLGKRLSMVVARRLVKQGDTIANHALDNAVVTIQGTEGMAVEFAKCCHPIPGDSIIGIIRRGQGLVVHTHDCPTLRRRRGNEQWLDVVWDKNISRLFEVSLKLIVANRRGVLAKVAAAIADAESNIENVSVSSEGEYTTAHFTLQVSHRQHLAQIMRNLRKIPEVVRITRSQQST